MNREATRQQGKEAKRQGGSERIQAAYAALESVTDPEIPVINVIEMGMIADVRVDGDRLVVDLTPTFVGCPAIDVITHSIREAMRSIGETEAAVNVVYEPPWSSDRITEEGRRKLKEFGLAPPSARCESGMASIDRVACPFCNSKNTSLESIFGPTLCRSIHYCQSCLQSFEHFKPV